MKMRRYAKGGTAAPPGAWLAFVALAVQVLLPFLVAYEIGLASTPADAETVTICHAASTAAVPGHGGGDTTHHGLCETCPLCTAIAAGQLFIATAPVASPPPRGVHHRVFRAQDSTGRLSIVAAPYQSRAPPSSV